MGYKKTSTQQNKKKKEKRAPVCRSGTGHMFGGYRTDVPVEIVASRRVNKAKDWNNLENVLLAHEKRDKKRK